MKILMGIILFLCGLYCTYSAIKSFNTGKTEDIEDGFPAIKKKKNPARFYLYTFTIMAGGIVMMVFSAIMLWVQIARL